jgi:DNA-binding response OmpR family regulator
MRKILIVEDEDLLRTAYEQIVSLEPYEVHTAKNGQEALELCAHITFDLILLDLMMPLVDGISFMQTFSGTASFAVTKVIILSNLSSGKKLTQALRLGAQKNVLKADLSPRQLLATIRHEVEA